MPRGAARGLAPQLRAGGPRHFSRRWGPWPCRPPPRPRSACSPACPGSQPAGQPAPRGAQRPQPRAAGTVQAEGAPVQQRPQPCSAHTCGAHLAPDAHHAPGHRPRHPDASGGHGGPPGPGPAPRPAAAQEEPVTHGRCVGRGWGGVEWGVCVRPRPQQGRRQGPAPSPAPPPQREQMFAAQEMFKTANKVTRPEKALILGFMAGSRGGSAAGPGGWGARVLRGLGDAPAPPSPRPSSPCPPQRTRARSRAT